MAKENTVYLYGRVKQPPRIYKNKAGQYVLGKIVVDTNRKSYATENCCLEERFVEIVFLSVQNMKR